MKLFSTHVDLFCEICGPSLPRFDAPAPPVCCPTCDKLMVLGCQVVPVTKRKPKVVPVTKRKPKLKYTRVPLKHQDQPWVRGSYDPAAPEDIEQLEALRLASEQGLENLKMGRTIDFTVFKSLQITITYLKNRKGAKRIRYGPKKFTIRWPTKQMIVMGDQLGSCIIPVPHGGREKKHGDDPDRRGNNDHATIGGQFKPTIEGINQLEALIKALKKAVALLKRGRTIDIIIFRSHEIAVFS